VGDFNQDGLSDVFWTSYWDDGDNHWYVSWGGRSAFFAINTSYVQVYDNLGRQTILLGDFAKNRPSKNLPGVRRAYPVKTDVFTTWGGNWYVSYGGTSTWNWLRSSPVEVQDILLGDFDGDGKSDVFTTKGGKWYVSYGGTGPLLEINTSNVGVHDILLGDFDGDGKSDVFTTWGGKWHVSYGGTSGWSDDLRSSSVEVHDIVLGDFNGDLISDVYTIYGILGRVSWGGKSSWQDVKVFYWKPREVLVGRFDVGPTDDLFYAQPGELTEL
jgi:hypothetical protein